MKLEELNALSESAAREELQKCCGSSVWVESVLARRPFSSKESLFEAAAEGEKAMDTQAWLEAFRHHPRIGDVESLRAKFASTATWAAGEQAGAASASEEILQALKKGNDDYFEKFGFIFIVCATGKSAAEMLEILNARLPNDRPIELCKAAGEQIKITRIRLEKLLA